MNLLSKEAIFAADDRRYEIVPCPEWGGDVRMRSLTGAERDEYESSTQRQVGNKQVQNLRNFRARLVVMSAVDGDGQPLFDQRDVIKLSTKNSAPLDRLFAAACNLSGFSDEDVKSLEEGFDDAQSEPSTSA